MPKSGLKHIDVGPELTKTEWESEESHELIHGNSFPDSPVERQLFYRDDEHKWYIYNGTDWVWLGGGGGGGMQVHGNEYHDPDFEQQGVAATLIETHRTTATHTQPQPPAEHGNEKHNPDFAEEAVFLSHKTRHQDGGADEISLAGLDGEPSALTTHKNLTAGVHGLDSLLSFVKSWYHEDWKTIDKWVSYVTGSGGYDWFSPADLRLKTGTTINSNSCLDTPQIGPLCLRDANQQWYLKVQAGSDLSDSEIRLYDVKADATKPPADTFRHVGWKIINGQIYSSTADGTTEKTQDTGVNMASIWTTKELLIKAPSAGVVEFYIDEILKTTHDSDDNVPDHYNGRFSFNIKNTVAADKQIALYTFNWRT